MKWPFSRGKQAEPSEAKQSISFNDLLERMAIANRVFAGQSVTPKNAMRCTTVHGVVRAFTNAIGTYPPLVGRIERSDAGTYVDPAPDHQLTRLLRRPNGVQTATEFYRMVMQQILLEGNFYALKGQAQTGPIGFLRPIEDPDAVTVEDIDWRTGVTYRVQFDEGERLVPQRQMLHVTSGIMDEDGVTGKSPVREAKQAIGICLAAEQMVAELYGNAAIPSMVLTGAGFANEEQYETWVKKWQEFYGAGGARGGTALLPEGMEPKELGWKPIDAQVLEMRKFARIEIAQIYNVPPHKLADLERATFSNIEEQSLEFVRDAARPTVRLIEQAATRDLLTEEDQRAGVVVRFDMEAATEGKLKDRIEAYSKAHDSGAMNPNEMRQRLGLPPRTDPGGDEYVTPLNMRTSNDVSDDPESTEPEDDDSEGSTDDGPVRAVR